MLKRNISILLVLAFICGPIFIISQGYYNRYEYRRKRNEISFGGGASNFLGELGGRDMVGSNFLWDLEFAKTSYVGQFSYVYYAQAKVAIRANLCYAKVSGDDALTNEYFRHNRNLNFESNIIEGAVMLEIHLKNERSGNRYNLRSPAGRYLGVKSSIGLGVYTFVGVGGFYFNPYGHAPSGQKYALKPLSTEGQGLPGGAMAYSNVSGCIPLGFGVRKAFFGDAGIKVEASYRFTFTDYIDDVSTVYYNNDVLKQVYGQAAGTMADPSLGITFIDGANNISTHTETGMQRGDPSDDDGYLFATVSVYKKFTNSAGGYNRSFKTQQRRRVKASF